MVTNVPFCIGNSGKEEKIFTDCIVPDDGVAGLIFETGEDGGVAIIVNTAFQRLPGFDVVRGALRSFVVRIINLLDNGFSRVKNMRIPDMMEEEEQIVGSSFDRFVNFADKRRILRDISGSGR